jgi:hypothetical protein
MSHRSTGSARSLSSFFDAGVQGTFLETMTVHAKPHSRSLTLLSISHLASNGVLRMPKARSQRMPQLKIASGGAKSADHGLTVQIKPLW